MDILSAIFTLLNLIGVAGALRADMNTPKTPVAIVRSADPAPAITVEQHEILAR